MSLPLTKSHVPGAWSAAREPYFRSTPSAMTRRLPGAATTAASEPPCPRFKAWPSVSIWYLGILTVNNFRIREYVSSTFYGKHSCILAELKFKHMLPVAQCKWTFQYQLLCLPLSWLFGFCQVKINQAQRSFISLSKSKTSPEKHLNPGVWFKWPLAAN